jgi:hypothetical protein
MDALGLTEMWSQQIEMSKAQGGEDSDQILNQILSGLNPNQEFQARFKTASNKFIEALQSPWSAQEIVDVWAIYYGAEFTDSELDQLIAFYTSPLGRKDVQVTKSAMVKFSKHFEEIAKPILERATTEYIEDLKL